MEHVPALPKIAEALAAMHICLKRCGIAVIPSTRSCVHGWESTMIRSCFRCRRVIQAWPFLDRAFFPLLYVSFILRYCYHPQLGSALPPSSPSLCVGDTHHQL